MSKTSPVTSARCRASSKWPRAPRASPWKDALHRALRRRGGSPAGSPAGGRPRCLAPPAGALPPGRHAATRRWRRRRADQRVVGVGAVVRARGDPAVHLGADAAEAVPKQRRAEAEQPVEVRLRAQVAVGGAQVGQRTVELGERRRRPTPPRCGVGAGSSAQHDRGVAPSTDRQAPVDSQAPLAPRPKRLEQRVAGAHRGTIADHQRSFDQRPQQGGDVPGRDLRTTADGDGVVDAEGPGTPTRRRTAAAPARRAAGRTTPPTPPGTGGAVVRCDERQPEARRDLAPRQPPRGARRPAGGLPPARSPTGCRRGADRAAPPRPARRRRRRTPVGGTGTVDEQAHRRRLCSVGDEGQEGPDLLAVDGQGRTARRHDVEPRAGAQHRLDHTTDVIDHVLAVVEHHQHPAPGQ